MKIVKMGVSDEMFGGYVDVPCSNRKCSEFNRAYVTGGRLEAPVDSIIELQCPHCQTKWQRSIKNLWVR